MIDQIDSARSPGNDGTLELILLIFVGIASKKAKNLKL